MKILYCISSFEGGGAERQLSYLATELPRKGIDIHIAYIKGGANFSRLQTKFSWLHRIRCRNNYDPLILWSLIRIIRETKPQIVQTWLPQMDIFAGLAAMLTKTPFVISERSSELAYPPNLKNKLRTLIGSKAKSIISNSDSGSFYWQKENNLALNKVIRNGIPLIEINQTSPISVKNFRIKESNELILFAGRFSVEKNLFVLLEAFRQVLLNKTSVIALMFGEGPLKAELVKIKESYGLGERLQIVGYTDQLWGWLKRASVFVSVSTFEGNPNGILEAAACKCPIVVSDIYQHREMLDDNDVYYVPTAFPGGIANGILKAIDDKKESAEKSERAYNKIKKYSLENIVQEYIDFYDSIID